MHSGAWRRGPGVNLTQAGFFGRTVFGANYGQLYSCDVGEMQGSDRRFGGAVVGDVYVRVAFFPARAPIARKRYAVFGRTKLLEQCKDIGFGRLPATSDEQTNHVARVFCAFRLRAYAVASRSRNAVQFPASIEARASRIRSLSKYTL